MCGGVSTSPEVIGQWNGNFLPPVLDLQSENVSCHWLHPNCQRTKNRSHKWKITIPHSILKSKFQKQALHKSVQIPTLLMGIFQESFTQSQLYPAWSLGLLLHSLPGYAPASERIGPFHSHNPRASGGSS